MKQMNLPLISTKKPKYSVYNAQNEYGNLLKQQFIQLAPDTVCAGAP
jgi:hypothetical protein